MFLERVLSCSKLNEVAKYVLSRVLFALQVNLVKVVVPSCLFYRCLEVFGEFLSREFPDGKIFVRAGLADLLLAYRPSKYLHALIG